MNQPEATFTVGQRVGIVSGLQAVGGPQVTSHGTVVEQVERWHGVTEYVVEAEDGTRMDYRPYLLRPVTFTVSRDGQLLATFNSEDEAFHWLLKHQGQSTDYAIRYGGYAITAVTS